MNSSTRLVSIAPGLAHSGMVSDRLQGVLRSRSFTIESRFVHFLTAGTGGRISVVIDGFEKIRSPIYGGLTTVVNHRLDAAMADDRRRRCGSAIPPTLKSPTARWSTLAERRRRSTTATAGSPSMRSAPPTTPHPSTAPHAGTARSRAGDLTSTADDRGACATTRPILAERLADSRRQRKLRSIGKFRTRCSHQPQAEGTGMNEHVHIRGSHKTLGEVVPRRFLTVLGGSDASASGRRQRPRRAGAPDGRSGGQSAGAAGAGQPSLAASFRRRHRPVDR